METPWSRATKTKSQKQEERIGKMQGGRLQVNSGRTSWRSKRDNQLHEFLIEARTTAKGSYSISRSEFQDLTKQAQATPPGCLPGMQVDIQDLSLMVIRMVDYVELRNYMIALEAEIEERKRQDH